MYMYHSFFIHSSVNGHLGCFHVLAVVDSVAVNTGVHVSFSVWVSSRHIPRSGVAGPYGGFIPSFLRTLILPSIVAASIYILTSNARGFPFLHTLSGICLQTF